ncbi:MAG: PA2169 family four-helix-bundle protein [Rudaea sp.]
MTSDTAILKDLVEVLNDGTKFYEVAAAAVALPQFRQIFRQMAKTKAALADDFKALIVASGESTPEAGTFRRAILKAYAEIAAKLSSTSNAEYVGRLEDCEDHIVREFPPTSRA